MKPAKTLGAALLAFAAFTAPVFAQDTFPSRSVRMIMPFPPGSGTDSLARIIAGELSKKWGQSVVVDNMTGAGGNIGGQTISRAAPDGYTLLFVPAPPLVINQFIYKSTGYDAEALSAITMVGSVPYVMVVRTGFPANTLKEFIAYVKANPGKISYASASMGSTAQLAALQLENAAGNLQMVHVPYRGAAPALVDVMNGHVDFVFDIVTTSKQLIEAGKVKSFGVAAKQRAQIMPNEPTMEENGLPGYQALTWFGMTGPPGLPAALAEKIWRDTDEALKIPAVRERVQAMGIEIASLPPDAAGKFFAEERKLWGDIVKQRLGTTLD